MPPVAFKNIMVDKPSMISVVIPVYGSAAVVPLLSQVLTMTLQRLNRPYEIILVCDNSPDRSWDAIEEIARTHDTVHGVLLRKNVGQHNAIMAGLNRARGQVIVTMDDDLQHNPEDIPILLAKVEAGHDIVYAHFLNRNHAIWKVIGSKINDKAAQLLLKKPKGLYLSPYRAMRAEIKDAVIRYAGPFVYLDGLILTVTTNVASVEVAHHSRYAGESGYSFKKSLSLWMKMATNFSIYPLRLTSFAGFTTAGIGFLYAIYLIIQRIMTDSLPSGWSSIIVTLLVVGGLQLLAIGMIGEYLGRALLTINGTPQYVIRKTTDTK